MSQQEATQLRVLDEQERIAWQDYATTGSMVSLSVILDCTHKKAAVLGLDKPVQRKERI